MNQIGETLMEKLRRAQEVPDAFTFKTTAPSRGPCGCIGPQKGEPLCPCAMRAQGVVQISGRWVRPAQDLGAAP